MSKLPRLPYLTFRDIAENILDHQSTEVLWPSVQSTEYDEKRWAFATSVIDRKLVIKPKNMRKGAASRWAYASFPHKSATDVTWYTNSKNRYGILGSSNCSFPEEENGMRHEHPTTVLATTLRRDCSRYYHSVNTDISASATKITSSLRPMRSWSFFSRSP